MSSPVLFVGSAAAPLAQGAGAVKTTASAPALLLKVVLAALALVGIVALALRSGQAPQARSKDGFVRSRVLAPPAGGRHGGAPPRSLKALQAVHQAV